MADTFNEGMLYDTHFVVLRLLLRRPQFLLIFIRHLTLIKVTLAKKIFQIEFK